MILLLLLIVDIPLARAELNLGLTGERMATLGGEKAALYWADALAENLGEEVIVRVFPDDASLFQWMERYRVVELGLASAKAAQNQPDGRFYTISRGVASDTVLLMRPDLSASRQESLRHHAWSTLPDLEQRHAVELARQGQMDEALLRLAALRAARPENLWLIYDTLVVLGWAEQDAEAIELSEEISMDAAPAYVLETLGKSLRNIRRYDAAIDLYARARTRFSEHTALAIGQVYALTDGGRGDEAEILVQNLRSANPKDPAVLEAGLYVARRQSNLPAQLDWSQRLLDLTPEHEATQLSRLQALDGLGASHLAVAKAEATPDQSQGEALPSFRANRAAHQVRWGIVEPPSEAERFAATDRALAFLEENLAALNPGNPIDVPLILQGRLDRLVALRDRVRMAEAVAEYERLVADDMEIPPFALQAAADAYLYLRRPEEARDLYLQVIAAEPGNFTAQHALFYAYIELEDFDSALPLIDRLAEREPVWIHPGGSRVPTPNRQRVVAEIAAAQARLFGDDLAGAQERLEKLRDRAPRSPDLVRQAGDVESARGWPRRARESYLRAEHIEPQNVGTQMSLAGSHMALREFDRAEPLIADLYRRFPENRQAQRLMRSWETHRLRELRAGTAYADNSGAEPASEELRLDATLFSTPFLTHYRAFASWYWSRADFPEGEGIYRRYGAGFEYRGRDLEGTFEISANQADGDDLGLALAGRRHLGDHWSIPFAAELFSRDTPLRALRNGIDADALRLGVDYLRDESGQWGLSGQWLDFSDGNRRLQFSGYKRERLLSRPHYKLDARLDLGTSSNSESDGPYFSPERDFSAELTLDNRWLLYRRYSFSFGHRLTLSGGGYWQRNYGGHPVASLLYEHNWQAHDRLALDYGAVWRRRVYDGVGETGLEYYLRLGWRF
ncbi:poly-beta-1,6 N-acetyl-D-glucosamine export porin PgaA [Trichloromonas sp.]|uniref:poly-beta-1,6 N-acetyl-D-glucosamine export porin PgaA n=1 Tax=Trichloromonas sp. TaxID=3069249 RepID=UPI002A417694|nr:poly-beta-1,6 N-acetyl-D-glucosamine export porin PgaA [Trichloromonas sp.]